MSELRNIRIVDIEPNPNNPRKHFDPEALDQLAASIREVGVLQPLVVVPLPVEAGQFVVSRSAVPREEHLASAHAAMAGEDPTGGALYFYSPELASCKWIQTRETTVDIGGHRFAR